MSTSASSRRVQGYSRTQSRPYHSNTQPRHAVNSNKSRISDVQIDGIYQNSRFTWNLTTLVGCPVEVTVQNGKCYEGIFKTFSSELELVLECAHLVSGNCHIPAKDAIIEKLIVNFNDIVHMSAINADTKHGEIDAFTDSAISRVQNNGIAKEADLKELTPWDGGEDSGIRLDESVKSSGWDAEDMFKHNEEKFGVKSTFDDSLDLYTTKLEKKNTPEYLKRQQEAERIAAEIERNVASRKNIDLENGDEIDEETKYSAVIRPGASPSHSSSNSHSTNKYTPPQMRPNGREKPQDKQTKSPNLNKLKDFGKNFKLNTNSSPQSPVHPSADAAKSSQGEPAKTAAPTKNQEVQSPQSSQMASIVSAAPNTGSPLPNTASTASASPVAAKVETSTQQTPLDSSSNSTADLEIPVTAPDTDIAKTSTLNPKAKDFVPKAKPAPTTVPPPQNQTAPSFKQKTASVSVDEARRQGTGIPNAAQVSGIPIFNSTNPAQSYVLQTSFQQPGRGQVPNVPQYMGHHPFPHGHYVPGQIPGGPPPNQQQLANMPPTPPTTHPQQTTHQPAAVAAGVMAANQTPTSQHFHPNSTVYHQNHQGASQPYIYPAPVSGPQTQQPPLQPSPHNPPAPSPVLANASLPPHSYPYHPPPQQFPQTQYYQAPPMNGSITQTAAGQAYPLMYVSTQLPPQYPHLHAAAAAGYYYPVQGNFQPSSYQSQQ